MKSFSPMTLVLVVLATLPALSMGASDSSKGVAAIQKVIQMLTDMQEKSKKEKNDEQIAFAEFSQWCKMQQANLGSSIKKGAASIESLGTSVEKLAEEAKKLGEDVSKLQGEIAKHEADMKARKNARAAEHAEYLEQSKDFAESVSALERAIEVMQSSQGDRSASSAMLLQVSQSSRVSQKAKDVIEAFLEAGSGDEDDGFGDYAAPEAHGYESQGGGLISTLKSLYDDFRAQKDKCDKEEANAKHAHDMVMMDLTDVVSSAKTDSSSKSSTRSKHQEKAALDKKQQKSTVLAKTEDESTLKDVVAECSEKKSSFDDKQELRGDEIEAIGKAISIMGSDDVGSFIESAAAVGKKMLTSSLAQLRSGSTSEATLKGLRHNVHDFISKEGKRLKSKSLALLAERLEADPFVKIKGLVKDMIEKLLKEANADADQEGFCDTEMGKSKATRTQRTEDIDSLAASIDDAKSEIMSLAESNSQLSQSISDINTARAEATNMRTAETKKNKETVQDAEAAIKAVDAATAVLKDFYEKASQATALVQGQMVREVEARRGIKMGSDEWDSLGKGAPVNQGHKEGQQTFGDKFQGNQDGATGVLAMIDVIRSDFSNLVADTKSSEESSLKSFDEFMTESKRNLATKAKKMDLNESDKAAAEKRVAEDSKDLKSNQDELVAAERYYEKLVKQCVDKGSSYEERTKARAAEIESLKEATKMLE